MNAAPRFRPIRFARAAALVLVGASLALPVSAQWAWRDANGRTVYSDQPPPPGIKPDQILRQPPAGVLSSGSAAPAPAAAAPSGPKSYAEREQEFRKRQQERAEAEKKQADEQALAARKKQECERAKGYLRQLEDGVRIARTDAQGNREILDDAQRTAEMARAREVMAATCN